uniref:Uncharacterized protein n=1 Tax=Accipiter nisus TaxID=211598 RepID=A0A8B9NHI2_9AVES
MPKYCRAPHCSNAVGQARPPPRSFYKSVPGRPAGTEGMASARNPAHRGEGPGRGLGPRL